MAIDLPEVHARALDATRGVVAGVADGQWEDPTPCEDWDVRTLVNHIVSGNFWAAELGAGQTIEGVGDRLDGDVLGEHPIGAYDRSAEVAAAVFRRPGAMDAPCAVSYGPVPGSVYCGHRTMDVVVHGWDVATATRQVATIPADLVEACFEIVEPQREMLVASGMFRADVTAPPGADRQTQLLAILGRRP
jgi:uncharacterized protein (TIGR03086 family)